MRILLKIFVTGLLLLLVVAVGTEVAAIHRIGPAEVGRVAPPIVVRKSERDVMPLKTVRAVSGSPLVRPVPDTTRRRIHQKGPAR